MNPRTAVRSIIFVLVCAFIAGPRPASADASHARIIRLSFVQGDVRFSRDTHGDPLNDDKALWEAGVLNLPVRQGYVLATDHGRAEVEFENGAMAFLNENTVLEFYDLSIEEGARTTRLILRQGTASFSVASAKGDYFSVTGGDFTAEVTGRAAFRVDNFDDGSTVDVSKGHITVAHKKASTPLDKGQALSMAAGQDSVQVSQANAPDDFDRWASGRVDSVTTATNASMRYANSPYYSSGFGDLYTYGSWFSAGGYGYGWRPYGVGLG
ncbi:MAG TPA: FecR family protein, partial [Candidatus Saccharimonadales bacterium]|nr:FecR family protein [Candidatus Saccharimonadales bacterium]